MFPVPHMAMKQSLLTTEELGGKCSYVTLLFFRVFNGWSCFNFYVKWLRIKIRQNERPENQLVPFVPYQFAPFSHQEASINPLSLNSDKDENSLYIITTSSNIQVRRIKEVIRCLDI